ncbi:MAG: hypothetical protein HFI55_14120 [Lachnospiraceae bacterium]|jgi:spore coat protein CotH|nr:hypothetical protein [Lachnospiraceae bacterium]
MISYKHMAKLVSIIMAAAVVFCLWMTAFSRQVVEALGGMSVPMAYEEAVFDTEEVMRIDIQMKQEEWEEMLENAAAKEYYACDVQINDQKLGNVGLRTKGNTSLSAIAGNPDTDRFSFKLEFDHYVEGQTCLGLDKLILNNNYADATSMKEAVVYDMYRYLGVDASLYNYAELSLNGEYLGVYLALEAVEDSFLLRNYGTGDGKLYKPDSMKMGGGEKGEFGGQPPRPGEKDADAWKEERRDQGGENFDLEEGDERQKTARGKMPGGSPSMGGGNGANLNYTDEELSSYSDIWDGEVTDTDKADHSRVVTALKNIGGGTDLEKYLDVDNLLKYMAVHAFSVNLDSLSGNMAHNYYLYEYNGMLNILPWDYNLAFGGMNMGPENDASETVNDAVDSPFPGTTFFDALLEDETYLSRYHEYLNRLAQEYVLGGRFREVYEGIRERIDTLVETDPTALYSYEEYEAGAEMLYQTVMLRAESVKGQIAGTIPATDEEQREDAANLVDASEIDISVMGVMDMGGGAEQKARGRQTGGKHIMSGNS